jgi:hypothetical protein
MAPFGQTFPIFFPASIQTTSSVPEARNKIPAAKDYSGQLDAILKAIADSKYDDSTVVAMLAKLLGAANENNDLLVKILEAIKNLNQSTNY